MSKADEYHVEVAHCFGYLQEHTAVILVKPGQAGKLLGTAALRKNSNSSLKGAVYMEKRARAAGRQEECSELQARPF